MVYLLLLDLCWSGFGKGMLTMCWILFSSSTGLRPLVHQRCLPFDMFRLPSDVRSPVFRCHLHLLLHKVTYLSIFCCKVCYPLDVESRHHVLYFYGNFLLTGYY